MRAEGTKRKSEDEDQESRLEKTIKYLKNLRRTRRLQRLKSARKGWREQVQQERTEEFEYMIKASQMFEFGSVKEAMLRSGKAPTTTKRFRPNETRRTEERLLRGDATAGSEESTLRIRGRGARETVRTRTCGGEADLRRREEGARQRPM